MRKMIDWKDKIKRPRVEENFCTGWGIVDGIITYIRSTKKKRKMKSNIKKNCKKLISWNKP
jgi:hypothetical protein